MPSCPAAGVATIAILLMSSTLVQSSQKTLPATSSCRLQLQLDQRPADTAWEIRGPFPAVDLVASRDFDYYQTPNALEQESVELIEGGTYYFLLTDYANDGIDDGFFFLTQQVANEDSAATTIAHGDGSFGAGQIYSFEVPRRTSSFSPLWFL